MSDYCCKDFQKALNESVTFDHLDLGFKSS